MNRKQFAVCSATALALLVGCSSEQADGNPSIDNVPVVIDAQASECGGLPKGLREATSAGGADSTYLGAEVLSWSVSGTPDTVAILHARSILNCAAKLQTRVSWSADTLIITEYDRRCDTLSTWGMAMCSCPFDTYVRLTGVDRRPTPVRIDQYVDAVGIGTDTAHAVVVSTVRVLDLTSSTGCDTLNAIRWSPSFP